MHTRALSCPVATWSQQSALVTSSGSEGYGGTGVAVQVLGSGAPELADKRAPSSYLIWQDGQANRWINFLTQSNRGPGRSGTAKSVLGPP